MIKYLAFVICSLMFVGCAAHPKLVYTQPMGSKTVSVGHNEHMEWKCSQTETDQLNVLLDCKFRNFSSVENETCVRVTYYTGVTLERVAQSNLVCSDPLPPETATNHVVAIGRQPRQEMLAICGLDSSFCRMDVREEKKLGAK